MPKDHHHVCFTVCFPSLHELLGFFEGRSKGQKSMTFLGPKIWNKVSSNIKTASTTSSFMHRLKAEILSKLQK